MRTYIFVKLLLLSLCVQADFVSLENGRLEYDIKGTGDVVVLFEAGAISGLSGWDTIWSRLPANIRAIRYSRRGEGASSACVRELRASDYVDDLEVLTEKLGVSKPFVYVAHSYGAKIARAYTQRHKEGVAAMLLVDPINPRDVDIVVSLNPENGEAENNATKQSDRASATENKWCFIEDIWDKSASLGLLEMGDIPITLIAGVKKHKDPKRTFDRDEARVL